VRSSRRGAYRRTIAGKILFVDARGQKKLEREARNWEQTTAILARFLAAGDAV